MSALQGHGAVWTEERQRSDEGRQRLKVARKRAGEQSADRGNAWRL